MTDDRTDSPASRSVADGEAPAAVRRALARLAPPGAGVSALAVSAGDGAVLAAADPDRAVAPASNAKLFTAAMALERFGPEHVFETPVSTTAPVADRVLDGDLVLGGSGAPDLAPADLRTLADAVAASVDRVEGDLVCDCSRFAGPQLGPGRVWTDERHAYGARSSALVLSGNVVAVTVGAVDGTVSVSVDPTTDAIAVDADVAVDRSASASGDDLEAWTDREQGLLRVDGRVPPGTDRTVDLPVPDPVRHCGLAARDTLATAGVELTGSVRIVDDASVATGTTLGAVASAPLADLVRTMNVDSENVVAEQLARAVAHAATGEGSWDAWSDVIADRVASLGVETVRLRDGSGLSRYNRLPARAVVALLSWARERPWSDAFFDSLPGPGEGTLADRLDGVPVVAKTGTLTGARALSGRIDRGDDAVLFAVLVGDVTVAADTVRDRQDAFVRALVTANG